MSPNPHPSPSAAERVESSLNQVDAWFTYRAPTEQQRALLERLREQIRLLASWYVTNVADSRERAIGLTQLRLAVMALNQGIIFSD